MHASAYSCSISFQITKILNHQTLVSLSTHMPSHTHTHTHTHTLTCTYTPPNAAIAHCIIGTGGLQQPPFMSTSGSLKQPPSPLKAFMSSIISSQPSQVSSMRTRQFFTCVTSAHKRQISISPVSLGCVVSN